MSQLSLKTIQKKQNIENTCMKKDSINYFMVGLFVLFGLVLFFVMLLKITGLESDSDEYFVELSNVTGIKEGIVVTYNGYEVGVVSALKPVVINHKTNYSLSVLIKSGWQIPSDSTAQIVMPAIISDKQIDISQGVSAQLLSPGDKISSIEAVDVMQLVNSLASDLNQLVPQSAKSVKHLLTKLNYSADQVANVLSDKNVQYLNNLFKHADSSGQSLAELASGFTKINKQLDDILGKTDVLLDENSDDIRYTVIELKKSIDVISGKIKSVMYNLDATSQNMNEFSRTLRNNPGSILGGKAPAEQP